MASTAAEPTSPLTHRSILAIAVPIMLSNVSTPLIGLVDTGVVGQLPDPAFIGAAAVGGLIFTFIFWGFGFLRMGTTGLTAQAVGARNRDEAATVLGRSLLLALAAGSLLILLQWPLREAAFAAVHASPRVESLARGYFDIRIWAAPATLVNYALLGWFIGLGRSNIGLALQLVLNLANMALDVLFVLGLGWDVRGVALGTLLAEICAAVVGVTIAVRHLRSLRGHLAWRSILAPDEMKRTILVNGDIMIRTLALITAFLWFTSQGARNGDVVLAANSILLQFISVSAFFLDGIAFATEALVGRAIGAAHRAGLTAAARMTTAWAGAIAVLNSAVLVLFGSRLIDVLTVDPSARAAARVFLPWAAGAPLLGVWAFQLDGIFIGATRTADMRNGMLISLAVFLAAWWLLRPFGNHGLWAAFYVHYLARAGTLLHYYPKLVRAVPVRSPLMPALGCSLIVAVAWPSIAPAGEPVRAPAATAPVASVPAVAPAAAIAPPTSTPPSAPTVSGEALEPTPEVVVEAPEPRYVAPTLRDRIGRIWAPVLIDGKGPFRLVLDTGASHSAVIARVADNLGLAARAEDPVMLRGVTGSAVVPAIHVGRMEVGELLIAPSTLPIVADVFGGADGVLGREGLPDKRIFADFAHDRLVITRSHRERAPPGFTAIPLRITHGGLLTADIRIGLTRAQAIIDTGGQQTVGNLALRQALVRLRPADARTQDIIGVTLEEQRGDNLPTPPISFGPLTLRGVRVTFGDMFLFEHLKLTREPTLLVGMDVLGSFDAMIIDYRLHEMQIRMRNARSVQ